MSGQKFSYVKLKMKKRRVFGDTRALFTNQLTEKSIYSLPTILVFNCSHDREQIRYRNFALKENLHQHSAKKRSIIKR